MDVEERSLAHIGTEILEQFPNVIDGLLHSQHGRALQQLRNELERFQLFAANLGLIHRGHSSLDYRLREAELLESTVRRLLQDLLDSLSEGTPRRYQQLALVLVLLRITSYLLLRCTFTFIFTLTLVMSLVADMTSCHICLFGAA